MPYEVYKLLHFFGIFLVFGALGGQLFFVINGGAKDTAVGRGLLAATHGLGLLAVLVGGFGMHAKLHIDGFPGWFLGKLAVWLVLGGLIAVGWRAPKLAKPLFLGLPVLGLIAAWLAVYKPF